VSALDLSLANNGTAPPILTPCPLFQCARCFGLWPRRHRRTRPTSRILDRALALAYAPEQLFGSRPQIVIRVGMRFLLCAFL